jgi:putative polyketide hydroxylase
VTELETEVLVVGGGPVGLTCAGLAAAMGVKLLLIERREAVSYYPKARALTARSLEIFRQLGVERQIHEAVPAARTQSYAMATSLTSPDLRLVPFGLGSLDPRPDTPCTGSFCTQDRLEPILEARLREEPAASTRFGSELVALEQDERGVTATAQRVADGTELRIRAQLVVGADGAASSCAAQAGIGMTKPVELDPALTVIFKARLSQLIDPLACVYLLLGDPATDVGGMVSGVSLARDPEEWSMVVTRLPAWGTQLTPGNDERWRALVRQVIGIGDLDVAISAVALWWRTATVAERLVSGRVVLAGDSAHLMPPAGGLGLNTGLQDAQNLAWRLAAVVNGSSLSLLDDYDRERRPEATRVVDAAVGNYNQGAQIDRIWNKPQLGLSLGTQYEAGSFIADAAAPAREYPYHDYAPSGRPGGRAPHFWLDEAAGLSVLDLFGRNFVLLVEWSDAPVGVTADRLQAEGAPIACCVLGERLTEDGLANWRRLYEVGPDGAVLVRPDGFIAWRSTAADAAGLHDSFWRILHNRAGFWARKGG